MPAAHTKYERLQACSTYADDDIYIKRTVHIP